jgi:hypothetical protein
MAPVGAHSEKSDEAYHRMERLYPGPRLELFARKKRDGWKTWGNELPPADMHANTFTSEECAKIRGLVADGASREEIAARIGVTVGTLQVRCSRLGISLSTARKAAP